MGAKGLEWPPRCKARADSIIKNGNGGTNSKLRDLAFKPDEYRLLLQLRVLRLGFL